MSRHKKPPLNIQVSTLWEYPSQHYGEEIQGNANYIGATPSYIIWNLLQRYTKEGQSMVDPMCGSGTTLDVAQDLKRQGFGFDLNPQREDIVHTDSRRLPLEAESMDFAFVDPPYSTHIAYSDDPRCIGKLSAQTNDYYIAMEDVIRELYRVLKPDRYLGLYVSDSYINKKKKFMPIGFELFCILQRYFEPVDIIAVVRHNKTLEQGNYRKAAAEENFFLRGFNYLFIMHKEARQEPAKKKNAKTAHKRARRKKSAG